MWDNFLCPLPPLLLSCHSPSFPPQSHHYCQRRKNNKTQAANRPRLHYRWFPSRVLRQTVHLVNTTKLLLSSALWTCGLWWWLSLSALPFNRTAWQTPHLCPHSSQLINYVHLLMLQKTTNGVTDLQINRIRCGPQKSLRGCQQAHCAPGKD